LLMIEKNGAKEAVEGSFLFFNFALANADLLLFLSVVSPTKAPTSTKGFNHSAPTLTEALNISKEEFESFSNRVRNFMHHVIDLSEEHATTLPSIFFEKLGENPLYIALALALVFKGIIDSMLSKATYTREVPDTLH